MSNDKKPIHRDVVPQRPSKSRRIKSVSGYFLSRAMPTICPGTKPAKQGLHWPELASCNGVMVMSAVKGAHDQLGTNADSPP